MLYLIEYPDTCNKKIIKKLLFKFFFLFKKNEIKTTKPIKFFFNI